MNYFGIEIGRILIRSSIQFIITFIIGTVLLHLATGLLGFKKRNILKASATVLLGNIVLFLLGFIPAFGQVLGLISFWYIIKKMYDVGWLKSIIAWLMSIVVAFIISVIILLLLGISTILFIWNYTKYINDKIKSYMLIKNVIKKLKKIV